MAAVRLCINLLLVNLLASMITEGEQYLYENQEYQNHRIKNLEPLKDMKQKDREEDWINPFGPEGPLRWKDDDIIPEVKAKTTLREVLKTSDDDIIPVVKAKTTLREVLKTSAPTTTTRKTTTKTTTREVLTTKKAKAKTTMREVMTTKAATKTLPQTTHQSAGSTAHITTVGSINTDTAADVSQMCRKGNLPNGIHAHPFTCRKFIECTFLETAVMDCPSGLVYDPRNLVCQHPSLAPPCQPRLKITKPPAYNIKPLNIDVKAVCKDRKLKDGNYPHPSSCDRFIVCSGGVAYQMTCPAGLHYHRHKKGCMDVHKVPCQSNVDFYVTI